MRFLLPAILLILLCSCKTTKEPYMYLAGSQLKGEPSTILKDEVVGSIDIDSIILKGYVSLQATKEPINCANIFIINKKTNKINLVQQPIKKVNTI